MMIVDRTNKPMKLWGLTVEKTSASSAGNEEAVTSESSPLLTSQKGFLAVTFWWPASPDSSLFFSRSMTGEVSDQVSRLPVDGLT